MKSRPNVYQARAFINGVPVFGLRTISKTDAMADAEALAVKVPASNIALAMLTFDGYPLDLVSLDDARTMQVLKRKGTRA